MWKVKNHDSVFGGTSYVDITEVIGVGPHGPTMARLYFGSPMVFWVDGDADLWARRVTRAKNSPRPGELVEFTDKESDVASPIQWLK